MNELKGKKVDRRRGWEYLKQMTFRLRVTRREHEQANLIEQQKWKKPIHVYSRKWQNNCKGSSRTDRTFNNNLATIRIYSLLDDGYPQSSFLGYYLHYWRRERVKRCVQCQKGE
ncbi:MAG: hypothetical protein V7K48_02180 [Nostoc sp.]|uniref:hypothetical protein n=1 Tax=Nostoc sp. TaxID=1180 RepID=UPI002FF71D4A